MVQGKWPMQIMDMLGQEIIKKNIRDIRAVDALIDLIKSSGDWIEPNNV